MAMAAFMAGAAVLSAHGAVGDRPGVLKGELESPLLVAALTGHTGRVYLLGTDGRIVWEQTGCGNVHCARLSGGRLFYSNGRLWRVDEPGRTAAKCIYDPTPAAHSAKFPDGEGVYGFDVMENGNMLVAENGTDFLAEVTPDGRVVRRLKGNAADAGGKIAESFHHHYRMCRVTANGSWLVCCSGAEIVREFHPTARAANCENKWNVGELAFDALRKSNGNTLVSHLSAISEYAPDGRLVNRFSCDDFPELNLKCLCGIQELPNGNIVAGTFMNGSPDGSRATAFEFTPEGKVVWSFASTNEVSMMCARLDDGRENAALRSAREQMRVFSAAAAKRFLADMKGRKDYDYARHAPAIEKLIAQEDAVRAALGLAQSAGKASIGCDAAIGLVSAYRLAMLANPYLPDRILCVRRHLDAPRRIHDRFFGGHELGFTGLNAHNHMDLWRTGFTNDIVVLEGCRGGKPAYTSLYAPPDGTSIVRDIDLDFDASRILFTSYRGTNDLLGVFEIECKMENGKCRIQGETNGCRMTNAECPVAKARKATLISPEDGKFDQHWWDACYLPNRDQIAMLGTAAFQFLPCEDGNYPMCVVFRQDRATGEVRQLTYEQDSDFTPTVTHDGRIMFTRWEYSDLPHFFAREIMTMNPDGVGQLSLWGTGSYAPTFMSCARSVLGEPHLFTMFGGGHHNRSEFGRMFIVDPTLARGYPFAYDPPDRAWSAVRHQLRIPAKTFPKEKTGLVHEFPGWGKDVEGDFSDLYVENQFARGKPYFAYPYPLSKNYHLATVKTQADSLPGIWLVDAFDNLTLVAENPDGILTEPMPFASRPRPPVIPDRSVKDAKTCSVHIADVYIGPGLAGVPRGTVKKLRVFSYHYNYHLTGGHSATGWIDYKKDSLDRIESSWDVKRILGTVDVEADGSVYFEMPAKTPVSFQPLDSEGRAVQLMRSWTVGMPGERVSCTGCHEDNRTSIKTKRTIADEKYFRGEIQQIKPVDGDGMRPWGFDTEMWPVVQRRCAACHGDVAKAPLRKTDQGGASETNACVLTGLRFSMTNAVEAYRALHPYIRRPGPESDLPILTPLDYHASTSPLVQILARGHHGVTLDESEWRRIYEWIDLNCPYWGHWRPKCYDTDKFAVACADPIARRKELAERYGGNVDDPEAEYAAYAAKVASRAIMPVMPERKPKAAKGNKKTAGVPAMTTPVACAAQLGYITEVPNITVKTIDLGNGTSITLRRIPAGIFEMGSSAGYPDEAPVRTVKIAKAFWMSETEVRNDQYHAFDPEHDSRWQDQFGKDHVIPGYVGNHRRQPVVRVSWNEAQAFCKWLSAKIGLDVRLPTEAEWEWAARAGSATPFPWGGLDDDFSPYANLADRDVRWMNADGWLGGGAYILPRRPYRITQNYPLHDERWKDDWFTLNYVARALPNTWGLYDMHGNAAEWTASDYAAGLKVVKGGSFASRPRDATSSWRWGYEPWQKVYDVGFRVIIAR